MTTRQSRSAKRRVASYRRWRAWRAGPVAFAGLLALVAIAPVAPASAGTTSKPYAVTITPLSVAGGSTTSFSVTLKNETATQQLGSASITPPSGFTVTSAPPPSPTGTVVSNVVQLRNLGIPPGGSITVTFSVTAPCTAGTGTWTIEAKQSNDFSGQPGNDLSLDTAKSSGLTTTVSGSCHLVFAPSGEPAQAVVNTVITTTDFNNPAGGPIEVDVLDGNNNLVTSSTAAITVTIDPASPDPVSGAVLGGTVQENAVGGKALFGNLTVSLHGVYDLLAASPGITSTSSSSFEIWDEAASCQVGCTASTPASKTQTAQVSSPSTRGYLLLTLGLAPLPPKCVSDGFNHAPQGSTVSSLNFSPGVGTKTLTVTIGKAVVQSNGPNDGVASYEVCYQNPLTGAVIDPLPSCKSTGGAAPCVNSITKDNAGNVVEAITLAGDDPNCW